MKNGEKHYCHSSEFYYYHLWFTDKKSAGMDGDGSNFLWGWAGWIRISAI